MSPPIATPLADKNSPAHVRGIFRWLEKIALMSDLFLTIPFRERARRQFCPLFLDFWASAM